MANKNQLPKPMMPKNDPIAIKAVNAIVNVDKEALEYAVNQLSANAMIVQISISTRTFLLFGG